jgi:hypothetical protein
VLTTTSILAGCAEEIKKEKGKKNRRAQIPGGSGIYLFVRCAFVCGFGICLCLVLVSSQSQCAGHKTAVFFFFDCWLCFMLYVMVYVYGTAGPVPTTRVAPPSVLAVAFRVLQWTLWHDMIQKPELPSFVFGAYVQ